MARRSRRRGSRREKEKKRAKQYKTMPWREVDVIGERKGKGTRLACRPLEGRRCGAEAGSGGGGRRCGRLLRGPLASRRGADLLPQALCGTPREGEDEEKKRPNDMAMMDLAPGRSHTCDMR